MKIRLNASLDKHFKNILFIVLCMSNMNTFATFNIVVTQFRTPVSLSERLHEGLLLVQQELEQISLSPEQDIENTLASSFKKMEDLKNLYDLMNTKSGLNEIHTDERGFLQNLIDRIDQMIQNLENSSSSSSDTIKKNISILHTLRTTLEY